MQIYPHRGQGFPQVEVTPLHRLESRDARTPRSWKCATILSMRGTLTGKVIGGKYTVTRLLGMGGMGDVYEAQNSAVGRWVAIKVIQPSHLREPDVIARLYREVKAAGTTGHPNLVELFDLGELEDGSPYVVMERLAGETLAQRLARRGPLRAEIVVEWVVQVLSAVHLVHAQNVIHRDIKPENIFLVERPGLRDLPKLLDFGISKIHEGEDELALTRAGMVMGTPHYMAPEQARGDAIDARIDLWALGVVLYEAVTGRRPFAAASVRDVFRQILSEGYPAMEDLAMKIPAGLQAVVDRALEKEPSRRYQTALEFQKALQHLSDRAGSTGTDAVTTRREAHPAMTGVEDTETTQVDLVPAQISRRES